MPTPTQSFVAQGLLLNRGNADGPPETFSTVAEITKVDLSGGKTKMEDATNFDSQGWAEKIPGITDAGDITVEGNYLGNTDVSQKNLEADFEGKIKHNWKIVLPGGRGTWGPFSAYVTSFDPSLPNDKKATFKLTLTITGSRSFA